MAKRLQLITGPPRPTIRDSAIPVFDKSCFIQTQQKCIDVRREQLGRTAIEKPLNLGEVEHMIDEAEQMGPGAMHALKGLHEL
jgi:hypothetical protein